MKGLWVKDLRLLRGQKQFFAAILIVTIVFMMTNTSFTFIIGYITIMMGMLTLTTISYDDHENGMSYLFTLPISRKGYVREKYLFGILVPVPVIALISAMTFIVSRVRHIDFTLEEWGGALIGSLLVVVMMLSLLIPIELKFGVEKSRIAMMIIFGGSFVILCAAVKVFEFMGIDWKMWISRLDGLSLSAMLAVCAASCGIILGISYLFSLRFLMKREF